MPEVSSTKLPPPVHQPSGHGPALSHAEARVLLFAPSVNDEEMVHQMLSDAGLNIEACGSMDELCARVEEGCGLVMIAEEALTGDAAGCLARSLVTQPSWSDLPIIIITNGGETVLGSMSHLHTAGRATKITLLERPFHKVTLVSTVETALRARQRQYQVRSLLQDQRAGEERLQAILESISDAFVALDKDWRFTYANSAYMRLVSPLYTSVDELIGQNLWEKFPDIINTPVGEFYRRSMAVQKSGVLEVYYPPLNSWLETRTHPTLDTLSIYIQDITSRKQAEAEKEASLQKERESHQEIASLYKNVRSTAERLSLALAAADLGDWEWDAATDLMTFSARAASLFNVEPGTHFTREHLRERLHEDDRERAREAARQAALERKDYNIEYRVMQPDGTFRWAYTTGRMTFAEDGSVTRMLGVVQDITDRKKAEEALRELTSKLADQARVFDTALSHITDFAYTFDLQGRFIYINKPLLDLWGMTLEQAVGKDFHELNYPTELATRLQRQIQEVIATKVPIRDETPYTGVDGEEGFYEYILSPVLDEERKVTVVAGSTRVITERKRTEQSLREVRARQEATLYAAEIGTWTWDIQNDLVHADKNLARLFYLDVVDEYCGSINTFLDAMHAEDRERVKAEIAACMESTSGDFESDYRLVHPGGSFRWVTARGKVQRDNRGRPTHFPGVVIDITQRKLQEQALATLSHDINNQARIFDITLSNIADLAYSFDREARFTYANRALQEIFGLPLREIVGKNVFDLHYPEDLGNTIHSQVLEVVATGRTVRGEAPFTSATGIQDMHEYIFNPVFSADGGVVAVAGTTRLATERKQYEATILEAKERAENANRSKDRFLAVLSHELRTPLTPVLMAVAALEDDPALSPAVQEDLRMVRRNVELETKLIDDLLDLSRITSGKLQLRLEHVDINNAVRDVCLICESQIYEKGLRLECDLDPQAGAVHGDSARLQQILWNLVKNAVKFTPEGGAIKVKTRPGETGTGSGTVHIEVSDSGIGIPADTISGIFDAFEQGDEKITQQFGGLGLGLAISKALVELHGGSIHASSEGEGRGATFAVELTTTAPASQAPAREPNTVIQGSERGARILLVEDHVDTARTLQRLLSRSGYEVQTAGTVREALDAVSAGSFDLILSDLGLPDATGFELMKTVAASHQIKGIAMSGYGMEEDVQKSRAAGFAEHLIKPVNLDQLRQMILKVLNG